MAGRRWGKDIACVNELIRLVLTLWQARVGKGLPLTPLVHAWIVAPTYKLAKQDWRELKRYMPADLVQKTNDTDMAMVLADDVLIECRSADDPESLVSVGLDVLLVTECGIISDLAWEQSLQPLLVSPGRAGYALLNGTPKGTGTWSHRLYLAGQDPLITEITSWSFSSYASPYAQKERLDDLRRTMPQHWFEQEIMAVFLEDGGGVFRGVDACATATLADPLPGHHYAVGVDLAKTQDFNVIATIDADTHAVTAWERFTNVDWPTQKARIRAVSRRYHGAPCLVDATSMQSALVDDLRAGGLQATPYVFTAPSKRALIEALQVAIEQRQISYPPEPTLLAELKAFTYKRTPAGNVIMEAPAGVHDDCVIALALAWWHATNGGQFSVTATVIPPATARPTENAYLRFREAADALHAARLPAPDAAADDPDRVAVASTGSVDARDPLGLWRR